MKAVLCGKNERGIEILEIEVGNKLEVVTKSMIALEGEVTELAVDYMIINTKDRGKLKIPVKNILGCHFSRDYEKVEG